MVNVRQVRTLGTEHLRSVGIEGPDADLLLAHALGVSRSALTQLMVNDAPISDDDARDYLASIERRSTREPLQHITGRAPFRHLELFVGPGVFVPRPETEVLVDVALAELPEFAPLTVVDLGTGSGAIAIALATERPAWRVAAVERSPAAYEWAARNVRAFAPAVRLELGDLGSAFADLAGTVDAVVTNPPYIPTWAVPIDPEVRDFDPREALYSGADGLDDIRTIATRGLTLLRPGGLLAIEHGEHQGAEIRKLLAAAEWQDAATRPDLTGRERVTFARAPRATHATAPV